MRGNGQKALMMARNGKAGDSNKEKIEFDRRLLKVECLVIHHSLSQTHLSGEYTAAIAQCRKTTFPLLFLKIVCIS